MNRKRYRKMRIRTVYPTKAQLRKLLFKCRLINSFPPPHSPHPAATTTTFGLYALYQCRSLRKVKISLTQIYQEFPVPCYMKTPHTAVLRPRNLRGSAGTERMKPTNSSLVHQNWRCHHQTWGWERRGEELVKEKTRRRGWGGGEKFRRIQHCCGEENRLTPSAFLMALQRLLSISLTHRQTQPLLRSYSNKSLTPSLPTWPPTRRRAAFPAGGNWRVNSNRSLGRTERKHLGNSLLIFPEGCYGASAGWCWHARWTYTYLFPLPDWSKSFTLSANHWDKVEFLHFRD